MKWGIRLIPALGCLALFVFAFVLRKVGGLVLPGWGAALLGATWGVTLFGYALRLRLLNRIGGLTTLVVALAIAMGMLLPKTTVDAYPQKASSAVASDFDAAWKAVYGKDLFREFSLHEKLMGYVESLSRFDVYRAGQIAAFALFGLSLGICFLFPLDPGDRRRYGGRLLLLFFAGGWWALQMELMQMLAVSREVSFGGFLEGWIGVSLGLIVFAISNAIYVRRKKSLADRRFNVLGVGIDAVNMRDCLELFDEIVEKARRGERTLSLSSGLTTRLPAMTTAMGVAGIVESRRRQALQRILNESVLNTPDGMPLVWLGRLFGFRRIERVYGPDLLRDACAYGVERRWRHYFWGAAPGIVEKLKETLEARHPEIEIAGICCPPFRPLTPEEEDALVEEVNGLDVDVFWIGISTPKQLYFMDHIRDRLKCGILCPVGYAFDVNAGVEKDAPDWIKYAGLQWLHRGIKQPRLWKRYLPDNPTFVFKCAAQMLRLKRFPAFVHERPVEPYEDAEGFPRFPAGCVALSAMTFERARDRVANWVETGQRHYVNVCTADTVVQCYDRPDMAKIVMQSGMATTDGMPLVWLARRFGFEQATRVYGPDLMLALCALSEKTGYSHYFYGATDEVLAQLRENLLKKFPKLRIAGTYSPPFRPLTEEEKEGVAERINAARPDIVWCGLGTPKQDYWVAEFRPKLECAALLAVGAAFNFHAGHVRQAPAWMGKSGLEWLFRLCAEPKRLWRRYLIGNPRFVFQTMKQWIRAEIVRRRRSCGGKR